MIAPSLLGSLFLNLYIQVKKYSEHISHAESIQMPAWGGNCIHWIVGHIVVSRCNFLMLLDEPSIWDWSTCKLFIPGSVPTAATGNHIDFTTLLADLDRTQNQFASAISRTTISDLNVAKADQTIGEQLTKYAAQESYHAGQLDILRQALAK